MTKPNDDPADPPTDLEQHASHHDSHFTSHPRMLRSLEKTLLKYNFELRGAERVEEPDKRSLSWFAHAQAFVLWVSVNLAVNNVTLGMLGPAVFELSFKDAAVCASLGCLVGSIPVAWIATFGPLSGTRTMIFGRYTMGWYPTKLIVILNLIVFLGYSLLVCIIGGQVLSAVSPRGSMSVVVGIIILAVITWAVTTFGISVFHFYERYAFFPQLIVFSILYGISAKQFDLSFVSAGNTRTVIANRLSFFSLCLSAAITYAGLACDFFVYWPRTTSRPLLFTFTLLGLTLSFTFTLVLGCGLASPVPDPTQADNAYTKAWTSTQGGSGSGALLVAAYAPLGSFGKFCAVIAALGGIANTIPPTYSSGIDFQILGRYFAKVPRVVWNTFGVIIYTVCALAGRNRLSDIFTNFLALMGYWVAIWVAILAEEYLIFRRANHNNYDWEDWNDRTRLPLGIAALLSFLVGWAGAILCMAQVWYIGPIAKLVGDYGADMGNYVGFAFAALLYPPLRWYEKRRVGR